MAQVDQRFPPQTSLIAAEERLRLLMENVADHAILFLNPAGQIVDVGLGAERQLGYAEGEVLGKHYRMIFTPEDVKNGVPDRELESATNTGRGMDERWHLRKDGSLFWASGVVEALRDEQGSLKGFVKILRDFTEKKMADEALARSQKDLEDFSYIIAHDLQSPLHKIVSFGELLEKSLAEGHGQEAARYVDRMKTSALKMSHLITGLLEYSKVTTATKDFELVDLNQVVKEVVSELEVRVFQSHAEIEAERLPTVYARPLQMHQVLLNLIDNAIKYANNQRPVVKIASKRNETEWIIGVTDNGPGVGKEDQGRIFNLFQRGSEAEAPGTGIGLTVCKRIIERHGGRIWVESQPGKGSTFYFTLKADRRTTDRRIVKGMTN